MANQEHLDILKRGVGVWNAWREKNPDVKPDLREADLRESDLREADLSGADLSGAHLSGANLSGANLSGANLSEANLRAALMHATNLLGAKLNGAELRAADLRQANLRKAYLGQSIEFYPLRIALDLTAVGLAGTDFSGADLRGADFGQVHLHGTRFNSTNLTAAKGLESCQHEGPSIIDHSTLAKSGKLPLAFLRGCGLPDFIIDNIPALQGDPVQFYSCFISYSAKDQAFADRLYADLQNKGIRCWFAPADMKIGDPIRKTIYDQIRVYEKLLLIFSEESVESEWVGDEVEAAFEEEKRRKRLMLFPIRLDDVVMETDNDWATKIRRTRHIGDFTNWKGHDDYQEAFDRLIRDLKQEAEKGAEEGEVFKR